MSRVDTALAALSTRRPLGGIPVDRRCAARLFGITIVKQSAAPDVRAMPFRQDGQTVIGTWPRDSTSRGQLWPAT
jgi:hypothetical protein